MTREVKPAKVEAESRAFQSVLIHYECPQRDQNPRILNLFCGAVVEEPALYAYFGQDSHITSIDHSVELEMIARDLGRKSFVRGNIARLEEHANGTYDLILMRNPPIEDDGSEAEFKPWKELFERLPSYMHKRSMLFMTLLNAHEYRIVPPHLVNCGYRIDTSEYNRVCVPSSGVGVPGGGGNQDYFVIKARPPNWLTKLFGKLAPAQPL